MNSGYKRIFLGLLISLFHINIMNVQIIPQFIGFILIAYGINLLCNNFENNNFKIALSFSYVISIMSFFTFISPFIGSRFDDIIPPFSPQYIIWTVIFSLSDALMFYYIFSGSIEYLINVNKNELAQTFIRKQRIYIILNSVIVIGEIISLTLANNFAFITFIVISIFIRIWLLILISRLYIYDQFSDTEPSINQNI